VGIIALGGLDAETGVVMLLYLDHAWIVPPRQQDEFDGRPPGGCHRSAVQRIRPKIMTILRHPVGLLPIMWSPTTQSGADVMKRIAAPMIGASSRQAFWNCCFIQ